MSAIRCQKCSLWLTLKESGNPCPRCGSMERVTFARDQEVAKDKEAVAQLLARKHFEAEAALQRIFRINGSPESEAIPKEPIKLLEVNANTVPSGMLPVSFGPAPASGVPYHSVIVEVSPAEFAQIETHELSLPPGWFLGEELSRPRADMRNP